MHTQSAQMAHILVVEDNLDLQAEVIDFLNLSGHLADGANNLTSMQQKLRQKTYQIVLLDLGQPDGDGLDYIADLRKCYGLTLGIIIVSARGRDEERIKGLELGADAYLVKPVNLHELNMLIARLFQRIPEGSEPSSNSWQLIKSQRQLKSPTNTQVHLTGIEFLLLQHLCTNDGIQSRTNLCETLYPKTEHIHYGRLDTLVSRLRQKVQKQTGLDLPIHTYRNKGYGLSEPVDLA
ncbi:response regulator transcription factor [Catenovulum sediminis]|uniref:Response regulator transcription factor n=1 Tax=Catenovulum sediminis TaxID=1740262 RepID=A0ABV1RF02_9ALTE